MVFEKNDFNWDYLPLVQQVINTSVLEDIADSTISEIDCCRSLSELEMYAVVSKLIELLGWSRGIPAYEVTREMSKELVQNGFSIPEEWYTNLPVEAQEKRRELLDECKRRSEEEDFR